MVTSAFDLLCLGKAYASRRPLTCPLTVTPHPFARSDILTNRRRKGEFMISHATAPEWRHNTFVATSVSEHRLRQSLRLNQVIWQAIDKDRKQRPGNVSRNTWITEAILDKLAKPLPEQKVRSRVA